MEDIVKKGMTLLQKKISEDVNESSTIKKPLVVITPVERTLFPVEAQKCVIDVISGKEPNEDTFLTCLYIMNFLNYPEFLRAAMQNIAESWELAARETKWKSKIKSWMWMGLGLLSSFVFSLILSFL
jgi:hypothetical protein